MQTEEGQAIFGRRKLIERIHAHYKQRGLDRLTVTGLVKTQAVALWHALANNLMVGHRLETAALPTAAMSALRCPVCQRPALAVKALANKAWARANWWR